MAEADRIGDGGLKRFRFFLLVLLLLAATASAAPDHVIANSASWQDVYSTLLYANLQGVDSDFLTSTQYSTTLLNSISTDKNNVEVISSEEDPFVVGYESILLSDGYNNATEYTYDNVNLELARRLDNVTRFIVMDDSYGYNAISAAPYAVSSNRYVLFADELSIGAVQDFLEERQPDDVIILGRVDREVRQALQQFDPETINEGGRFDNNIAMVERYLDVKSASQAILTNGEFIEQSIMSGSDPVVFIGRQNVPSQVRDFIQDSDISVGILVGNELIDAATFVRRQLGLSVFVKFAQGARSPQGSISEVEDLDRFPLPSYSLNMSVTSAVFNEGTSELEVTYENTEDLATYFRSTISLTDDQGTTLTSVGDNTSVFLGENDVRTVTYPTNLPANATNASIFTVYGESPDSLENQLETSVPLDTIDISDNSQINLTGLVYDRGSQEFRVHVDNIGEVTTNVDIELVDLVLNEEQVTVSATDVTEIPPGESATIPVPVELSEADVEDNQEITVRARYGERELALIKEKRAEFAYQETSGDYLFYALIAVAIVLILLIIRRRRKEE